MFSLRSIYRTFPALKVVLNSRTSVFREVKWGVDPRVYFGTFVLVEKYDSKTQYPTLCIIRSFAKKKVPSNIPVDEQELSEYFDVETIYSDFKKPLIHLRDTFIEQLSLRSSSNAIHQIKVKYEGETLMIQDLANIRSPSPREVILDMGAFVGAIPCVTEALRNSPLKLNPEQSGTTIIVPIAKVTREHRETLAKGAKKFFFDCRTSLNNIQSKYIKKIDCIERLPKDKNVRLKTQIALVCKKYIAEAQNMLSKKEEELLSSN